MGNICCCKKRMKRKIVLLLVGLDNAGKTVAAKGLAGESVDSVVPTVGFSVVNLSYHNYIVKVFDLGGGPNIRGIWHKYFVDAHGVIFVVDSSDISRLDEAKDVLGELLSHEKIARKPVLVLANKQDNENALDEVDIIEKLDLEEIVNGNECPTLVESCSAVETPGNLRIDPGIKKGYEWLLNYIVRNYEILNKRVEEDVMQQIALENRLRMEKIEKIRALKEAELKLKQQDDDAIESYSNYERKMNGQLQEQESDVSETSSDSFPPVYHVKDEILLERPKSAVQIIRQQLELNAPSKKSSFISRASNKTAPLHLYGIQVPRSASAERRKILEVQRRHLKSAGDAPFRLTELPNVPMTSGDEFHNEIYDLMNFDKKNGWFHKTNNGDINGISVVNVDL
ncbi:ADP-ribosylation factor-like protein 13B [Tribolium madens]|uniref:ADP-ribosylation factor-like protein 13B n=1 Tax=Tribolium madens TaxID=41895 RepID=UPI001CF7210B|nr:ADP-ribosylation factor-like protein 13B [Tribolium madens]